MDDGSLEKKPEVTSAGEPVKERDMERPYRAMKHSSESRILARNPEYRLSSVSVDNAEKLKLRI